MMGHYEKFERNSDTGSLVLSFNYSKLSSAIHNDVTFERVRASRSDPSSSYQMCDIISDSETEMKWLHRIAIYFLFPFTFSKGFGFGLGLWLRGLKLAFSQERKKKKNILPIDHIISSKKLATLASKPKPTNFPFCPSRVVVPQTSFSPGEDSIVFLEEGGKSKNKKNSRDQWSNHIFQVDNKHIG